MILRVGYKILYSISVPLSFEFSSSLHLSVAFSTLIYSLDKKRRNPDANIYKAHISRTTSRFYVHSLRHQVFYIVFYSFCKYYIDDWWTKLGKWPYSIVFSRHTDRYFVFVHRFSVCYLFEKTSLNKNMRYSSSSTTTTNNTEYGLQFAVVVSICSEKKSAYFYTCCTLPVFSG